MQSIRILAAALFAGIVAYTIAVTTQHGLNFVTPFMNNLSQLNWAGQFNLDFLFYLLLAAIWIAWRHNFSASGLLLALLSMTGGMIFFSAYLFIAAGRANGSINGLLLGKQRAATNQG